MTDHNSSDRETGSTNKPNISAFANVAEGENPRGEDAVQAETATDNQPYTAEADTETSSAAREVSPAMDNGRYMVGQDSTTIGDVVAFSEEIQNLSLADAHKALVAAVDHTINTDVDALMEGRVPTEVFDEMARLGYDFRILLNRLEGFAVGFNTSLQIKQGAYYGKLKEVADKAKIPWDKWAEANIKGVSMRSIHDCIRLSKFEGMDKWAFMGKERLISIVGVSQKAGKVKEWNNNLIKNFIEHSGIRVGDEPADNFAMFRLDVDTAVNVMRLANEGIDNIAPDRVKAFTERYGLLTRLHMKDLEEIDDNGGDVQARFEEFLGDNSGKPPKEEGDKGDKFRAKVTGFTNLLKKALKEPDSLEGLDEETIQKLKAKVNKLELKVVNKR